MGSFLSVFQTSKKTAPDIDDDLKKYINEVIREGLNEHFNDFKRQNTGKNEEFENLKRNHEMLIAEKEKQVHIPDSIISDKAIGAFVQKLIDDPNTNIYGFPDKMEKALYNKLLKTILHAVAHISDESAILLFGHRIRIVIQPLEDHSKGKEDM
ncbi:MAG TPA: hypothetical protein PKD85_21730 [Saprospiraceae bacterium]|nr:hypothetical protein [Saprospiraceae bacterium]